MATEGSNEILGVEDQQLAAVAGLLPALPNIRAGRADRFAQAVRTLVERRAQQDWPNESHEDFGVFVMVEYPRQVGEEHEGIPFADPMAQRTPLLGYLFFSNSDASAGRLIEIPTEANAILEWLGDQGLGDCPIVTVYRQAKEMVTRREGANALASYDVIRDQEPAATLPELMEALRYYHQRRVLTPTSCPRGVWEGSSADRYIPGPNPEKSIQSDLETALNFWFRGVVKAESEDKTNIGRIDVRLLKRSEDTGLGYWVILELKVIKSFTNVSIGATPSTISDSTNIDGIIKGVRQAAAYRENREAEEGLLEIYDLRQDKREDLTQRESVSITLEEYTPPPEIHVWPVFGRAEDARNAGFTGA